MERITDNKVVAEMVIKVVVVVTVVVVATVVVVEETVDVVPVDMGPTITLLTKTLGIICPGTNVRPLLKHGNVQGVRTIPMYLVDKTASLLLRVFLLPSTWRMELTRTTEIISRPTHQRKQAKVVLILEL